MITAHRFVLRYRFHCYRFPVTAMVVLWLAGNLMAHAARAADAKRPDLLRLESLTKKLQPPGTSEKNPVRPEVDGFLLPTGDDVDAIMEVDAEVRVEALRWLDDYVSRQSLFADTDLQELRRRLQTLPPAAIHRWLDQTSELRERLVSEEWTAMDRWLAQFLAAQAIYSESELASFRQLLARTPANRLHLALDHFHGVRDERLRQRSSTVQHRQLNLDSVRRMQWTPRAAQAGALAGKSPSQDAYTLSARSGRRGTVFYPSRSLSQRAGDLYIYRAIYGNNFLWWGLW